MQAAVQTPRRCLSMAQRGLSRRGFLSLEVAHLNANPVCAGVSGKTFADVNKALDERTIGHNPERLCLMKVSHACLYIETSCAPSTDDSCKLAPPWKQRYRFVSMTGEKDRKKPNLMMLTSHSRQGSADACRVALSTQTQSRLYRPPMLRKPALEGLQAG